MNAHWSRSWPSFAVLILALGSALPAAQAEQGGTNSGSAQRVLKSIAEHVPGAEVVKPPTSTAIEQVLVSRSGQQTQVRVEGSSALLCSSFRLNDPERLVLDCSNARVNMQQKAISSGVPPVLGVRLGQFKESVARLVIDLEKKWPYSIRASANAITVVFDPVSAGPNSGPKREQEAHTAPVPVRTKPADYSSASSSVPPPNLELPKPALAQASTPPNTSGGVEQPAVASSEAHKGAPRPAEPHAATTNSAPKSAPVDEFGWNPPDQDYVLGPQDVLAINVWREPEISRVVPVRPDGRISLPLLGEIAASGLTPSRLQSQIAKGLEAYIHKPQVTVIVQEANSHKFYILGEVERPGVYTLTTKLTVTNALAAAGGFREFAKVKDIYVLRPMPDGSRKAIPFNLKSVVDGRNPSADLELQPADMIVVP